MMKTDAKTLTIFTSLPPVTKRIVHGVDFGEVYQRACIASWVDAGFDVVSVNPAQEIEKLKEYDFPIRFYESEEQRPTIATLLQAAQTANTAVVGFINADCFLLAYSEFVEAIATGARDGLLMIERVNIDPVTLLPSGKTCLGFDAFFFETRVAAEIAIDPELAVGQPWWDYWFPAEFALKGKPLLRLASPAIFHLDHDQGWSQARWLAFGRKLLERLAGAEPGSRLKQAMDLESFADDHVKARDDLGGFGDWCFNWLRDNATLLPLASDNSAGALFAQILNALTNFEGMHEATLALAKANSELAGIKGFVDDNIALKDAHRSARVYVEHLEGEIIALREAHRSAERHANHLETEAAALREAHGSAEAYAKHLERESQALRDNLASLNSGFADLHEAHRGAERHAAFQAEELARLNDVIQNMPSMPPPPPQVEYSLRAVLRRYWRGAARRVTFNKQ